jgi:hypothetical protein
MTRTVHGPLTRMVADHLAQDLDRARLDAGPDLTYLGHLCLGIDSCRRLAAGYTQAGDNPAANHFRWLAEGHRRALEAAPCGTDTRAAA